MSDKIPSMTILCYLELTGPTERGKKLAAGLLRNRAKLASGLFRRGGGWGGGGGGGGGKLYCSLKSR